MDNLPLTIILREWRHVRSGLAKRSMRSSGMSMSAHPLRLDNDESPSSTGGPYAFPRVCPPRSSVRQGGCHPSRTTCWSRKARFRRVGRPHPRPEAGLERLERSLVCKPPRPQVLAARHRSPVVVSTSCPSPFASTTTTTLGSWKHSAAARYPSPTTPVSPTPPEPGPYADRRSQIPSPNSGRFSKSVISSNDEGDTI